MNAHTPAHDLFAGMLTYACFLMFCARYQLINLAFPAWRLQVKLLIDNLGGESRYLFRVPEFTSTVTELLNTALK